MKKVKDITGQRFGKLTALYRNYWDAAIDHSVWRVKCDCGNERNVRLDRLMGGAVRSCGCMR